jgi:hypothetical protein
MRKLMMRAAAGLVFGALVMFSAAAAYAQVHRCGWGTTIRGSFSLP